MRGGVAVMLSVLAMPSVAWAHSGGAQGASCSGCHGTGEHEVVLMSSPSALQPGATVEITLRVEGSGNVAGIFVAPDGGGSVAPLPGQGMAQVGLGLTHTLPRSVSGGGASFTFAFEIPDSPGATRFSIASVLANGNGNSGGDQGDGHELDVVYGCEPQTYYRDFDGDGYGRETSPRVFCAGDAPQEYAATGDDCDDNRDTVHPGAVEFCNLRDDDCNGQVDDDAIPVEQYPDADGDGYYSPAEYRSGETFVGCVPTEGWAAEAGDCAENDETRNPGVEEVCNLFDDNCDGRVDERVRPTCGVGWCRRESNTCDAAGCTPGEPIEEICNLLDDDCDGFVDEDAPCDPGLACIAGTCREPEEPLPGGTDDTGTSAGDDGGVGDGSSTAAAETDAGASAAGGGGCAVQRSGPASLAVILILGVVRRRRLSA
ncbi:MAG: putative metal-binding motif-containing protein [Myxococcota bacterium]